MIKQPAEETLVPHQPAVAPTAVANGERAEEPSTENGIWNTTTAFGTPRTAVAKVERARTGAARVERASDCSNEDGSEEGGENAAS